MTGETNDKAAYFAAIDKTVWDLTHKKEELASAETQIAALTAAIQNLEEHHRQHQAQALPYIENLEYHLNIAQTWQSDLEKKLADLQLEQTKRDENPAGEVSTGPETETPPLPAPAF